MLGPVCVLLIQGIHYIIDDMPHDEVFMYWYASLCIITIRVFQSYGEKIKGMINSVHKILLHKNDFFP